MPVLFVITPTKQIDVAILNLIPNHARGGRRRSSWQGEKLTDRVRFTLGVTKARLGIARSLNVNQRPNTPSKIGKRSYTLTASQLHWKFCRISNF
jgi:hypothetical protein